jgi:hypothetical protein
MHEFDLSPMLQRHKDVPTNAQYGKADGRFKHIDSSGSFLSHAFIH